MKKIFGEKKEDKEYIERVGAYGIIIENGKLVTSKAAKGHYLIGGEVKIDENFKECIKREALEETGYEVEVLEQMCESEIYWESGYKGDFHLTQYYFLCKLGSKICQPIENDTFVSFLPTEDICKNMVIDAQKWAVIKYIKKLENIEN